MQKSKKTAQRARETQKKGIFFFL